MTGQMQKLAEKKIVPLRPNQLFNGSDNQQPIRLNNLLANESHVSNRASVQMTTYAEPIYGPALIKPTMIVSRSVVPPMP